MLLGLILAAQVSGASCSALKAAAKPAIDRANGPFIRQLQAGDAAAIAEAYADDGLFIGPDGTTLKGKAAVDLIEYQRAYQALNGAAIEAEPLVAHILATFIEADRGFQSWRKTAPSSGAS